MSWLSKAVGADASSLVTGVASAINSFVETGEEKKAAELLLLKAQQEPDRWQAEINKIGAAHRSVFVAGWRPFIGWVCGVGLAWAFIIKPLAEWGMQVMVALNPDIDPSLRTLPVIETGELMSLVFAMLGMGGIRSWEKSRGLTK